MPGASAEGKRLIELPDGELHAFASRQVALRIPAAVRAGWRKRLRARITRKH